MTVTDLDALLRLIAEATTALSDAERATTYIVRSRAGGVLVAGGTLGRCRRDQFLARHRPRWTVGPTGETINIADPYADERFNPENDRRTGFRTRNLPRFR